MEFANSEIQFRVVQRSRKSTIYQRLTNFPPFVSGDVRGSCEVWGWSQFVGEGVDENNQINYVNNQQLLYGVWNERFRRATAESRGLYPEGLSKGNYVEKS